MRRINEIKQLLNKYDYLTSVRKVDDGIVIVYPHPKLLKPKSPRIREAYSIRRGKESGVFYNNTLYPNEKFMGVPEYAIRMFLIANVINGCQRVPISDELILFLDAEGMVHEHIEEIVDPPSTEMEQQKEAALTDLVSVAKDDSSNSEYETMAFKYDIHEGFRLIRSFFAR